LVDGEGGAWGEAVATYLYKDEFPSILPLSDERFLVTRKFPSTEAPPIEDIDTVIKRSLRYIKVGRSRIFRPEGLLGAIRQLRVQIPNNQLRDIFNCLLDSDLARPYEGGLFRLIATDPEITSQAVEAMGQPLIIGPTEPTMEFRVHPSYKTRR
jgi:hypothetical protein